MRILYVVSVFVIGIFASALIGSLITDEENEDAPDYDNDSDGGFFDSDWRLP